MLTTKINLAWIVVKSGKLKKMIVAATNTTNEGDKDEDQDNSEKDEEKDDTSDGSEIEGGEEGIGTLGTYNTLWDTLTVEVGEQVDQVEVLEKEGAI
ncbi:hypothetical protein VE04_04918 [Pseudogymnoascus sp. 24MN13]|nr:hypothetical protein VE04_04918 [Pseudogymnoascus sp. 24MN13]